MASVWTIDVDIRVAGRMRKITLERAIACGLSCLSLSGQPYWKSRAVV